MSETEMVGRDYTPPDVEPSNESKKFSGIFFLFS